MQTSAVKNAFKKRTVTGGQAAGLRVPRTAVLVRVLQAYDVRPSYYQDTMYGVSFCLYVVIFFRVLALAISSY